MPEVATANARLRSFVERIERLEEERRSIGADLGEVYKEAKGAGFDTKTIRELVRLRRLDDDELAEREALLDTYKRALGMLAGTPLGDSAMRRAAVAPEPEIEPEEAAVPPGVPIIEKIA